MYTLGDIICLAIEQNYNCEIWNVNTETIIYNGKLNDIPYNILNMNLMAWEILDNGFIQFDVE